MEKVYIDDLLKGNTWKISQGGQTQLDTQDENIAKSHNYCEAIDIASGASTPQAIYAPIKMRVMHKNSSSNRMVYQSVDQVQFASGVTDYFCLFVCHANDANVPSHSVGNEVNVGGIIYAEGTKKGNEASGVSQHIHMHCGRGTFVNLIVGDSTGTELITTNGEVTPSELFLRKNSKLISGHRRVKWLSASSTTNAYLHTTTGLITIRSSIIGTSLKTVSEDKLINIRLFEKRDFSGYTNSNDKFEWARASYTENGYTYAGFVQLDTGYYSLQGGSSSGIKYSPCYQDVNLRTGLPYKNSAGTLIKIEEGKVYLKANPNIQIIVNSFVPGLQADGYSYAKVQYNSTEYYAQVDTKNCYVLSGGLSV